MDELIETMQGKIQGDLVVETKEPLFFGSESPYRGLRCFHGVFHYPPSLHHQDNSLEAMLEQ